MNKFLKMTLALILISGPVFAGSGDLVKSVPSFPLADANVNDDLTIDGGTIDDSVIGGNTPAAGTFTDLVTDNLDVDNGNIEVRGTYNTTWDTAVAVTVDLGSLGSDGWYSVKIDTLIRRTAGGTDTRRLSTWNFVLSLSSGSLSIVTSGETTGYGGYAPTQIWDISGTDLTHTITSTGSSGTVSYQITIIYRGTMS